MEFQNVMLLLKAVVSGSSLLSQALLSQYLDFVRNIFLEFRNRSNSKQLFFEIIILR